MTTLNLLPLVEQRKRKIDLLNYYTLMGGVVLVTGALVLAAILLLFDQVYRVNLDTLKGQKAQAESQAALYLDVQKKAESLEKQLTSLKLAQNQTTHWSSFLTELQNITPPTVSVRGIKLGQSSGSTATATTKTELSGHADTRRSAGEFQLALNGSPLFKNAELQTTTDAGGGVDYTISTEINYDKLNGPAK